MAFYKSQRHRPIISRILGIADRYRSFYLQLRNFQASPDLKNVNVYANEIANSSRGGITHRPMAAKPSWDGIYSFCDVALLEGGCGAEVELRWQ